MAKKKSLYDRIQLVYRHSPLLLKCILLAAIVFSAVALTALRLELTSTRQATDDLRAQAAQIEQDNQDLNSKIQNQGTEQGIRTAAEEELGYVDPDTVFFDVVENQN